MSWIALRCGRRIARGVLHLIAAYFVLFAPAARRASTRYLGRIFGRPPRWRELYAHVFCFAATILDRVYFLRRHTDWLELTLHGHDTVLQALDEGRGAFLMGAHVGSFEALRAAAAHEQTDKRIAMVMYPDNARKINAALAAIAPDAVPDIIALGRPESMLQIRDRLAEGVLIGILADRALQAESPRAQFVRLPFLGTEAVFSDAPFRLADLLRQRIVFMVGLYLGGPRYEVRFEPLADFSARPADAAEREARIRAALAAYVARLESLCREQPYNWFNFHDFWREDAH
ncbi:acyl-CoA synthetase [Aquincola sp. S2]|uniref:Acyl-CoA synthetase n=2 Tax=Pseudaquabacterium terrae TaxID=2732868 RepID=A0ABX2EJC0_9BURK|nr:acyl-CoA synthetase [Aquabacterium terrae]NRF68698.1 acyl-CoA synthetase [Aquabacterium terrae]